VERVANLNAAKRVVVFPDDGSNLGKFFKEISIDHGD